ncbi:unnamed protein product [Phytophthora fragariaefolia]|uniref:Unnamed protein product n=1 Tax=Phytophthora fragariaefolia TaxID=1490495 RepID=A0A9W6WUP2_9STRA|nr:unnamed protein product [Phytophthora fragariaefolia]
MRGISRELVIAENETATPIKAQIISNHVAKITETTNIKFHHEKNRLSLNRSKTANELDDRVGGELAKVEDDNWKKYYRRVQEYDDMYAAALEDCPLVSEEDETIEKDGYDSTGDEAEQLIIEEKKGIRTKLLPRYSKCKIKFSLSSIPKPTPTMPLCIVSRTPA